MILDREVTVNPPPVVDQNGKIMQPPPLTVSYLDVTYHDNPTDKVVYATIKNFPGNIVLLIDAEYVAFGDYTQKQIEEKLRNILKDEPEKVLRNLFPKTLEDYPNGPGTILSGMISALGIKSTPNCSCRRHALEMNERGPDWCEANLDTIIGWLRKESENRKLPFIETIARIMVKRAIAKSRRLLEVKISANVK